MVTCRSCGGEFDEALVRCPFCGSAYAPAEEKEYMGKLEDIREDLEKYNVDGAKDNTAATYNEEHGQNMKKFGRRFNNTRNEVIGSAHKTKGLATRAAILAILIITCVIMTAVISYNYSYHDPDEAVRKDALKNAATYVVEAEEILKRGEYSEFMSYLYSHELQSVRPEELEHLRRVSYVADEYYNCIKELEEIVLRSDDPDYFDGLDSDIRIFCMYADGFYEVFNVQRDQETNEECLFYMDDMRANLEAAMRAYFSMDESELEDFLAMSETKKAVKLEEIYRHE